MDLSTIVPGHTPNASETRVRREWDAMRPVVFPFLLHRDGGACRYCGSTEALSGEHLTPIYRGGTNDPGNLGISCIDCNREKHVLTDDEYKAVRQGAPRPRIEGLGVGNGKPSMIRRSAEVQSSRIAWMIEELGRPRAQDGPVRRSEESQASIDAWMRDEIDAWMSSEVAAR